MYIVKERHCFTCCVR